MQMKISAKWQLDDIPMQISCVAIYFRVQTLKKLAVHCKSAAAKAIKKASGACVSPRSPDQLSLNSILEQENYLNNATTDNSIVEIPRQLEETPRKGKILGLRNNAISKKPDLKQRKIPIVLEARKSSIASNIKKVEHRAFTPKFKLSFSKKMKL